MDSLSSEVGRSDVAHKGIVFVLNSLERGGSERKTAQLANGLVDMGWRVAVTYLNAPDTLRDQFSRNVVLHALERRGWFSIRALRRLVMIVEKERPGVVVAVNVYPIAYLAALKWIRRRSRVALVASLNTYTFSRRSDASKMRIYAQLLKTFDLLVFGAQEQWQLWAEQYGLAALRDRSKVLYNGVDTTFFCRDKIVPVDVAGWPQRRIVIGTVSAMRREKGHAILVDAVAEVRRRGHDVGLLIVGDGPERAAITGRVRSLGLERDVHFAGDADDVRQYLAAMHIFVLPSVAVETFSNATLEAMAMGCPIIATRIGGMPEMLRDGGGMLVEPGNVNELVDALCDLLSSEDRRVQLAWEARQTAEQRFGVSVMVKEFGAMIGGLAAAPSPDGRCP